MKIVSTFDGISCGMVRENRHSVGLLRKTPAERLDD